MTVRAIGGLLAFNLFILGVGAGVLWGVRGWRWWTDAVRLAGVAYLLGVASLMIGLTFGLVVGIPIRAGTIVICGVALVGVGLVAGRFRGHSAPRLRPPGWRFPGLSVFAALFVAGIVIYLEGLFRADRLSGVAGEWDSWAIWMPKAKELYFSGRLEPEFLLLVPQLPSYPPGLATVQAGAFHAMESADTVSLHVQYWFFAVGFAAAATGLLARRVHHAILFPVLLAFLVAPSLVERMTTLYADIPLGYLVALAGLLLVLWVQEQKTWHLAAATPLLAGAMLTKREGLLFAACLVLSAFVASWADRRQLWRRLSVAALLAFALALPWRIWFTAHGLEGDGPEAGYFGAFTYLDRVWPSLELAVTTLFAEELWRLAPVLGVGAIVVALLARTWSASVFAGSFLVAAIAGSTWAVWAHTGLRITREEAANPIIRITGTTVLVLAVLTPLLLQQAWSASRRDSSWTAQATPSSPDALLWRSRAAWVIVLVGILSHPGAMLVGYSGSGLPGGAPRFTKPTDCVSTSTPGDRVRLVVGYADSYPEALAMRSRAGAAGLEGAEVAQDGCGRLRVFLDDVLTAAALDRLSADARAAGFEPTLELDPDA